MLRVFSSANSSMEMAFKTRRDILIQTVLCSLLSVFLMAISHGAESDIFCLKSIKDSLEDPHDYVFSSWNFNNNTEGFICRFNGVECWHPDENRVLNLKLRNMGLKGQFPRAIRNCTSLTSLDLSINELSGPIPSDIPTLLKFATAIDLSSNKFSGEIPASLANCTYLNALKLDNNMLSGQIPRQLGLLTRIKSFTVSNNHLSGPVPNFDKGANFHADSYANNWGLCGGPLEPCSLDKSTHFHESFRDSFIVGYVFSLAFAIFMSYYAPWKQLQHYHRNKVKELIRYVSSVTRRKKTQLKEAIQQVYYLLPPLFVEKESKEMSVLLERLTSTMRFEELSDATDSFTMENAIGVGKMGITYEGRLPNGCYIAVKRLFDSQLFNREFLLEIMIPGKYKHRNIVPLLGFCIERKERILVYEYMSKGRLSKWLHPVENEVPLTWPERVKIAHGVARGLSWLHHSCNLQIVHFNICSECILIDEDFEPKISNFGEARFMNPNIENDLGIGMRCVNDGKKDVHDFGSLLFKLITGETFKELFYSSNTNNLCGIPSNLCDAIDKSLIGKGFENEIFTLFKVACECLEPFPDQRPTMLQVYNKMKNIWEGRHRSSDDSDTSTRSEIVYATS